jgi:hypothetical protein
MSHKHSTYFRRFAIDSAPENHFRDWQGYGMLAYKRLHRLIKHPAFFMFLRCMVIMTHLAEKLQGKIIYQIVNDCWTSMIVFQLYPYLHSN